MKLIVDFGSGCFDCRMTLFSLTRKNPLVGLMGSVFAGIVTFVVFLTVTAFLTGIFAHSLDSLMFWAVVDTIASVTFAFVSVFVALNILNRP